MKHKVRMLKSEKGVHDGEIYPVHFEEGTEYEIGSDLLSAFISTGSVELVDAEIQPRVLAEGEMLEAGELPDGSTAVEVKSEGDAPENQALASAPENKKRKK